MYRADLHVHTTASDGLLAPSEVVEWAAKKEVDAVAITDHDSVSGIDEAIEAGRRLGVCVIPGIEFSCTYRDEEIHILGYFIDHKSRCLNDKLKELAKSRESRGLRIIEKLLESNIEISYEEVKAESKGGSVGRPHIARILVKKGIASSVEEAFRQYLVKGKLGYVDREKITVSEAADLIHGAGGVVVMAHPGIVKNQNYPKEILRYDIDGIEVIHSAHDEDTTCRYEKLASSLGMAKTAGSDCHGNMIEGKPIIGDFSIGKSDVEILVAIHKKHKKSADECTESEVNS